MAVRLTYTTAFSVSSTTNDEKDLGNGNYTVRTDAFGEGGTWKTLVAAAASDLEIRLDNIATARFLFLRAHPKAENDIAQEITFKLNSVGGDVIKLTPPDDKKEAVFLITSDSLTALYVSNAGTVDVELTISVCGD